LRAVQQRLRKIPARVAVYLLLAAALFEECGYLAIWQELTAGLGGLPLPKITATALWHARCRLGSRPLHALFDLLRGHATTIRTAAPTGQGCWSSRSTAPSSTCPTSLLPVPAG
jgi:hypothetical protein